ncbi:hypothetical protein ACLB90_15095 [Stenotrophomonas sp. LGBM10]|uniref:hypothetical protein n=1 Tax=Stenotrophomonas sp. LGBM10 TaxID=3390038 RepID=UPI00398A8CE7
MLIAISDVWRTAEADHLTYVVARTDAWMAKNGKGAAAMLRAFILKHRKAIAIGRPTQLRRVVRLVEGRLGVRCAADRQLLQQVIADKDDGADRQYDPARQYWCDFMKECERAFSYRHFTTKHTTKAATKPSTTPATKPSTGWDAHALCRKATCRICPYCQQAYAFTLHVDEEKVFRPTLDHYYAKSIYPYLAVSLYNLVPSCYTCNSALKRDLDFLDDAHLHPFEDREDIQFTVDPVSLMDLKDNRTEELIAIATPGHGSARAKGSCDTFRLTDRYALNGHELAMLVNALQMWTPDAIAKTASGQGCTAKAFEALLFQFDPDNYANEMLGRMKKDVIELFRKESADHAATSGGGGGVGP